MDKRFDFLTNSFRLRGKRLFRLLERVCGNPRRYQVISASLFFLIILPPALAGAPPHTVWGELYNNDGSRPSNSGLTFTALITARPSDTITCGEENALYQDGYWQVLVGNFEENWSPGEVLEVSFTNFSNGQRGTLWHTLTDAVDPEQAADFYLSETPSPSPTLSSTPTPSITPSPSTTPTAQPTVTAGPTSIPSPSPTVYAELTVAGTVRGTGLIPLANARVRLSVPDGRSEVGFTTETGTFSLSVITHLPAGIVRATARKSAYLPGFTDLEYSDWNAVTAVEIDLIYAGALESVADGDYDGDGSSDLAVFRPATGLWAIRGISRLYFGAEGDEPVPADYDGDGTARPAVWRPASGLWAVRGITRRYYGIFGDSPVPGDYDGDGTADLAVYRSSTGLWSVAGITRLYFGGDSDHPVAADYDGDGRVVPAVFRDTTGLWALRGVSRFYFGSSGDLPLPGDWSGAGWASAGIFRPVSGLWALRSETRFYFGQSTDMPVHLRRDLQPCRSAVFRAAAGLWAVRGMSRVYFGGADDLPVTR